MTLACYPPPRPSPLPDTLLVGCSVQCPPQRAVVVAALARTRVLAFVDPVEGSDSVALTTLPDPANDDLVFQLLGPHVRGCSVY